MNIVLNDYQNMCFQTIIDHLKTSSGHVSVNMPAGTGKTVLALTLAEELSLGINEKVALVYEQVYPKMHAEQIARENNDHFSADFLRMKDFDNPRIVAQYKYFILDGIMKVSNRMKIAAVCHGTCTRVISFFDVFQSLSDERTANTDRIMSSISNWYSREFKCLVFYTKNAIDIRDAKYYGDIYDADVRIQAQKGLTEVERQLQEIKSLKRELEKQKAVQEGQAKMLAKQKLRIERDQYTIKCLYDLFRGMGIDSGSINLFLEACHKIRDELKDVFENQDVTIRENAYKRLQDKTAIIVCEFVGNNINAHDAQYYEDHLIGSLTKEIWNKLDDRSKRFLVSAKICFNELGNHSDSENLDYSGVCLLVTKALEVEITKRFCVKYKDYLRRQYSSIESWPYATRRKENGYVIDEEIGDDEFTLGSLCSFAGVKRITRDGQLVEVVTEENWSSLMIDKHSREPFTEYCCNKLFHEFVRGDFYRNRLRVIEEIKKDICFIEKVRVDYRNPAAHTNCLSVVSAKECFDYVLDIDKKLKAMISTMRY